MVKKSKVSKPPKYEPDHKVWEDLESLFAEIDELARRIEVEHTERDYMRTDDDWYSAERPCPALPAPNESENTL